MLLAYSKADTGLAFVGGELYKRLCQVGQLVEHRVYDEGEDHDQTAANRAGEMFTWIDDRMNGQPATSSC